MERLFEGVELRLLRSNLIAAWAGQMRMAIRDFGVRYGNAEQIRDHAILTRQRLCGPSALLEELGAL